MSKNHHEDSEAKKQILREQRQALQQLLINSPESLIIDKGSDAYLDRQLEKVKLISGAEISLKEVRQFISSSLQKHDTQFKLEFYVEIYRILGIKDRDPAQYYKPKIIADITNETIYSRFDKDVLPTLQQINYYKGYCIRVNKHYQYLNTAGIEQLQVYISDSIRIMKTCNTYYEYRKKLFSDFGIKFQLQLFD